MKTSKLSILPQKVDEDTWYYELPRGIEVIRRVYDIAGNYLGSEQFLISWKKLRVSLKRKDSSN